MTTTAKHQILIVGGGPVGSLGPRRMVFQERDRLGDDAVVAVLDSCDGGGRRSNALRLLSTTDDRRRSSGPMVSAT